jgi:uncharacterized membrane protein YfcA
MLLLGRAKLPVGMALGSGANAGEGNQNLLCAYLAAGVLTGLVLNLAFGLITTPAGVSGAVLLPIQLTVLHVPSPAVTHTNLLFNVAAIPGGLLRFRHERRLNNPLTGLLVAGTLPGVVAGAVIGVELLSGSRVFSLVGAGCSCRSGSGSLSAANACHAPDPRRRRELGG